MVVPTPGATVPPELITTVPGTDPVPASRPVLFTTVGMLPPGPVGTVPVMAAFTRSVPWLTWRPVRVAAVLYGNVRAKVPAPVLYNGPVPLPAPRNESDAL